MNYTVVWLADLEDTLVRLYLAARADGAADAFTHATAAIDRRLSADPLNDGESRDGSVRVMIELPISVDYEVDEARRAAVVTRVRYHPPR